MKIGTDAVLLGAWTEPRKAETILDIGTGCGVLAMMMAQKTTALIDAIDVDQSAIEQAKENVKNCSWSKQIKLTETSFQDFYKTTKNKYDLIISNPPFFSSSLKSKDKKRTLARHNDQLGHEELVVGVKKLLTNTGRFVLILPYNESKSFKETARIHSLYYTEELLVKPKASKGFNRSIITFTLKNNTVSQSELIIYNEENQYTEAYKKITSAFYLNF